MRMSLLGGLGIVIGFAGATAGAQESMDELLERGDALFHAQVGCWVCHGPEAAGLVGPSLHFGPTPMDIYAQLESNPMMAPVMTELNPSDEDLIGVSLYIRTLAGPAPRPRHARGMARGDGCSARTAVGSAEVCGNGLRSESRRGRVVRFRAHELGAPCQRGQRQERVRLKVVRTWDPGEPKFKPRKNHTYFYENLGVQNTPQVFLDGYTPPNSNQIVVGDARTKRVIASYELPIELKNAVHTSAVSPDGKYVYIVGPRAPGPDGQAGSFGIDDDDQGRCFDLAADQADYDRCAPAPCLGVPGQILAHGYVCARPGRSGRAAL